MYNTSSRYFSRMEVGMGHKTHEVAMGYETHEVGMGYKTQEVANEKYITETVM